MSNRMHLVKLCVGASAVDDLIAWQNSPRAKGPGGLPWHVTRMWPKKATELLNGGSLYWVFKGMILCRQPIADLVEVDHGDGVTRCGIVLHPTITQVTPMPKRPFQGWRYLKPHDAPRDMCQTAPNDDHLPPELEATLSEIGVI
jgi:hypothetical protein